MSDVVFYRFPHGTEMRWSDRPPQMGDVISRGNQRWRVIACDYEHGGAASVVLDLYEDKASDENMRGDRERGVPDAALEPLSAADRERRVP